MVVTNLDTNYHSVFSNSFKFRNYNFFVLWGILTARSFLLVTILLLYFMLPNEKISCVLQICVLYTESINFLLKFAANAFQCCSSLVKYYSSESMLLLILSYVSSNMHVSSSFLKNSSFWKIRETQNKHLIIWKKLFEIYKFIFVMLNLLNSSLNSVWNLLKIHFVS